MRIEKVNDNQLKFMLCKEELEMRGIDLEELRNKTLDINPLIQEIRQEAIQLGFSLDDAHHVVELIPKNFEELIVIITKMQSKERTITKPNFKSIHKHENNVGSYSKESPERRRADRDSRRLRNIYIYKFPTLDAVIEVSKLINGYFLGYGKVYKYKSEYYLVMEGRMGGEGISFLTEHGERVKQTNIEPLLKEHGETIVTRDAISKLSSL